MSQKTVTAMALTLLVAFAAPLAPASAQEGSDGAAWTDAKGDTRFLGFSFGPAETPATPSNAATDAADLLAFAIGAENETHVTFTVDVADLDLQTNQATNIFSSMYYQVSFRLNGEGDLYELSIQYSPSGGFLYCCPPSLFGSPFVEAELYRSVDEDDFGFGSEWRGSVPATMDMDAERFTLLVERDLLDVDPSPIVEARPMVGDRLTDIQVYASTNLGTLHNDQLPDEGTVGDFTFQRPSADGLLEIRTPGPVVEVDDDDYRGYYGMHEGEEERALSPGKPKAFPLVVTNRDSMKRIVNLTTSVDAQGWEAKIVPNIQLGSNESATVNVIVTAPDSAPHRDVATVRVLGTPLGRAGHVGVEELRLFAAQTPGPAQNVLYFHSSGTAPSGPTAPVEELFWAPDLAMNTQQTDPLYSDASYEMGLWFGSDGYYTTLEMDTPLGQDLLFDPEGVIGLTLMLSSKAATSYDIEAALYAGGKPVGYGEASGTVDTSAGEVLFEFKPAPGVERIPADGSRLELELTFREDQGPAGDLIGGGLYVSGITIDPAGSFLTLPLLDPGTQEISVSTGEFLPSLSFRGEDAEAYINPGRVTIFNLTLVNEGLSTDAIQLKLNQSAGAWPVEIRPATKFKLASGEKANLSLWVAAPADAGEGDNLTVVLEALSASDPAAKSRVKATIVATEAIDIPDERPPEPEKKEKKKSPGASVGTVLALLAVAGFARRRRD